MKFSINSEILERFPGLNIGIVIAKNIDNSGSDEEIMAMLHKKQDEIRQNFETETLSQNPKIDSWRKAYSSFGAKPKKNKCSVENLYRMTLSSINLNHINKIVDIYNYVSIKYIVPVGGDDIDNVEGDIKLRFARGDETFVELNSDDTKNPKEGEVVYSDDKEVLCRRWNWRECDKSKMIGDTKNVCLVVEGLPPVTKDDVENIAKELGGLVQKFCGGEISTYILNKDIDEILIE